MKPRFSIIEKVIAIIVILIVILSLTACGKKVDYTPEELARTVTKVEQTPHWMFPEYCISGVVYIGSPSYFQPKINPEHIKNPNLSIYTPCN
jgi:predicted small lipoprotein YifL